MNLVFEPIRPKKISEEIVEQIKEFISKGELKPGERIPSERELASMLSVSRPSVREAIMILDAMGLLQSVQGGGTYVRSLADASISDPLFSMVEGHPSMQCALMEVRMGLETWSVHLAASRITDEEIAGLKTILDQMEKGAEQGGWDAEIDGRFHYAITAATHNTIQIHVLNAIHNLFHDTIQAALTEFYRREGYVEVLLRHHREIYEVIAKRDPDGARQKMMEHLVMVEEKMNTFCDENAA